jgi:hypothetical protein
VYENLNSKISYNISERNIISLTIPFTTKNGNYKITEAPLNETIGGLSNLNIEYKRKFGQTNAGTMMMSLGVPTGKYDHRRDFMGTSAAIQKMFVVPELQTGNGLFSLSLGTQYSLDKDWGMIMVGGSYTAMFAKVKDLFKSDRHWGAANNLFSDEKLTANNDFSGSRETNNYQVLFYQPARYEYNNLSDYMADSIAYAAGMGAYANKGDVTLAHQYYTLDEKGNRTDERMTGDFYGDVVNVFVAVGLVQESCVHSLAIDYSYKFRADWYVRSNYGETIQNDYLGLIRKHYLTKLLRTNTTQLWNLSYGLEISSLNFPVFLAGTLTLNGAGTVQAYTGTIGVKGSFF